jgi:hypothetical protein
MVVQVLAAITVPISAPDVPGWKFLISRQILAGAKGISK